MKGREELREFSFFWCVNPWTQEKDSRELPSTFLETKERKVRCKFLIYVDPWEMGAKEFLESSFFEKVKEEIKVQPIRTKKE